jgi:hypothetical protein
MKMGPTGCPETLVMNYHYTLRDTPEERISHVHPGGNLKSRMLQSCLPVIYREQGFETRGNFPAELV